MTAGDTGAGVAPDDPRLRGHRVLPHTADLIVEAWAPTRLGCLEEAVAGLVEAFAATPDTPVTRTVPVHLDSAAGEDLLVLLLEEIVYLVDVLGVVPVGVSLEETEDGGIAGDLEVVLVGDADVTGAVPKGVSRSDLVFEEAGGRWGCRVVVDV